jgi:hypothetical protein
MGGRVWAIARDQQDITLSQTLELGKVLALAENHGRWICSTVPGV